MCKIVILFSITSKMCKIGLQPADHKITSPVIYDIVFWTLFILSGRRTGQNPLQMTEHSAWILRFWVETPGVRHFLPKKWPFLKNIPSISQKQNVVVSAQVSFWISTPQINTLYIFFTTVIMSQYQKH